jgi:CHAT domain-containing protein/TPR repeat protein
LFEPASESDEDEEDTSVHQLDLWACPSGYVRGALTPETALIELVRFRRVVPRYWTVDAEATYAAFVWASGESAPTFVDLGPADGIDSAAANFASALERDASKLVEGTLGDEWTISGAARELAELVIEPLLRRASRYDVKRLLIAADGALGQVPLHAVPLGDDYLIDRYEVGYLGSGRDLLLQREGVMEVGAPVVFADPDYNFGADEDDAEHGFERLEGAEEEGREIAALLGVTPILDVDVTEGKFRQLSSPCILHVAAHGWFLPDAQEGALPDWAEHPRIAHLAGADFDNYLARSGLVLAGFNAAFIGRALPEDFGDGVLTAAEAASLDLAATELVVLSACETGLGHAPTLEGALGLRRAFSIAGAHTVILSHWKVPDEPTRLLMVDFYRQLLEGLTTIEALRAAALALRGDPRYSSHPFIWAGFACHGNPRPLSEQTRMAIGLRPRSDDTSDDRARRLESAAEAGDADAAWELSELLVETGGSENAVGHWTGLAARGGNRKALSLVTAIAEARGDIDVVRRCRQLAAEVGDANAAFMLGYEAQVAEDLEGAEQWYKAGAKAGHPDCAHNLGVLLSERGSPEAVEWWRLAAAQGSAESANNLALNLHADGDLDGAARYWEIAAAQGHVRAAAHLGDILYGRGDKAGAEKYFRKAAAAGDAEAAFGLGVVRSERGDRYDGRKWFHRAAQLGHENALIELLLLDEEEEEEVASRAAAGSLEFAQELAYLFLARGDEDGAKPWLAAAAKRSGACAMRLADLAEAAGDSRAAQGWRARGESLLAADAEFELALQLQANGQHDTAEEHCRNAAQAGHGGAAVLLAAWLIERDSEEAMRWLMVGADAGNPLAGIGLAEMFAQRAERSEARRWLDRALQDARRADGTPASAICA